MTSPFQRLIAEFDEFDRVDAGHVLIVVGAMALGALVGAWVSRRRAPALSRGQAWRRALTFGVTFPLVTCVALFLFRLTAYGASTGMLPKLSVTVFASLSVIVWLGVVTHLAGALPWITSELDSLVIPLGKTPVSMLTMLQALGLVAVTLLGALWLSAALEARLMASPIDMSMRLVFSRLLRAALFVLALLIALSAVGIDLTVLSVFGGALGVGLGLGLQKIAANYVSGFAMLMERSFRVGDSVKIDGFEGQITNIHALYSVVRAANGRESVVPNEMFIVNRVENLSLENKRVAFTTKLQIDYASDVEKARALIVEAAAAETRVLKDPAPNAMLTDFAPDGLEITLAYWIADPETASTMSAPTSTSPSGARFRRTAFACRSRSASCMW